MRARPLRKPLPRKPLRRMPWGRLRPGGWHRHLQGRNIPWYPMGFDFGDFFGSCYLSFCGISWDFMGFHGGSNMGLNGIYPLVNAATELYGTDPPCYDVMEKLSLYRLGHDFKFADCKRHYQRVVHHQYPSIIPWSSLYKHRKNHRKNHNV